MPTIQLLPAPPVEWDLELINPWSMPLQAGASDVQSRTPSERSLIRPAISGALDGVDTGSGASGLPKTSWTAGQGAGVGRWQVALDGSFGDPIDVPMFALYNASTATTQCVWIAHPAYHPPLDPSLLGAGYVNEPGQRVGWWRWRHMWGGSSTGNNFYTDDATGVFLFAYRSQLPTTANAQDGATPQVICGFVGASAVAPGAYRFVTFDAAGAVLTTTAVPGALVPDARLPSTFEFIVLAAAPGRPATLQARVNGAELVTLEWGSASLLLPSNWGAGQGANRFIMMHASTQQNGGGVNNPLQYISAVHFRGGAFLPPLFTPVLV